MNDQTEIFKANIKICEINNVKGITSIENSFQNLDMQRKRN